VFRRVIEEGFNQGHVEALDDCFSGTFHEHRYGMLPSLAGLKGAIAGLRRPVPDLTLTIVEMVSSDDKLWARMTARDEPREPLRVRSHRNVLRHYSDRRVPIR
jgi:hypothetical protein